MVPLLAGGKFHFFDHKVTPKTLALKIWLDLGEEVLGDPGVGADDHRHVHHQGEPSDGLLRLETVGWAKRHESRFKVILRVKRHSRFKVAGSLKKCVSKVVLKSPGPVPTFGKPAGSFLRPSPPPPWRRFGGSPLSPPPWRLRGRVTAAVAVDFGSRSKGDFCSTETKGTGAAGGHA